MHSLWVQWKQIETSEGIFDWSLLEKHIAHSAASGWRVSLRLLTSRTAEAPAYLATKSIPTLYGGSSYDPAAAAFHARYLALLGSFEERRLCQHKAMAVVFVGYASESWGDEFIGPHGEGVGDGDPALLHPHVKQRLDAWANACKGMPHKVLMGGESMYGTGLGFGTRNGFVEHCKWTSNGPQIAPALTLTGSHGPTTAPIH